jgi:hypothetical protein
MLQQSYSLQVSLSWSFAISNCQIEVERSKYFCWSSTHKDLCCSHSQILFSFHDLDVSHVNTDLSLFPLQRFSLLRVDLLEHGIVLCLNMVH